MTALWCCVEVRDEDRRPLSSPSFRPQKWEGGSGIVDGVNRHIPCVRISWDGWGWFGRKHSQYLTRNTSERHKEFNFRETSHSLLLKHPTPLNLNIPPLMLSFKARRSLMRSQNCPISNQRALSFLGSCRNMAVQHGQFCGRGPTASVDINCFFSKVI